MLLLGFRGFRRVKKRAFVSFSYLGLMAGIALFTATVVGGSGYLIRELHRQAGLAKTVVGLAPADPTPVVPISSDMLNVSSISLGSIPVAVVNSVAITQGELLHVHTPTGNFTLRVVSIRDGIVQFKYGEQTIFAGMR